MDRVGDITAGAVYHFTDAAAQMKTRRHHNNKGRRQVRRGKTENQVRVMAKRLGLPYRYKMTTKNPRR